MMNANSPTCAREKPACIAIFSGCPESNTPKLPNRTCPHRTSAVRIKTGTAYSHIMAGSIIIPTDTKKTEANRSFTGCTICAISSALSVSASRDPMTNAPSAAENPAFVAIITIPRHSPREVVNSISLLIKRFNLFRRVGIR